MNPLAQSPWKQRFLYLFLGLLFATICMGITLKWMDIVPYGNQAQQPEWLKGLREVVPWLPWISCVVVLLRRFVKGRQVRVGFYVLGTATPKVALIGFLFLHMPVANFLHSRTFDAAAWRNEETVNIFWPPRLCMVDHLMSSGQLDGLEKPQVIQLLGPPNDKSKNGWPTSCDIHYYLGPCRGFFRVDSEWLYITFGDDGKINRYWLYRD